MKTRKISLWVAILSSLLLCTLSGIIVFLLCRPQPRGGFTNEMKIVNTHTLAEGAGAAEWNRMLDHPDSPYFYSVDFYNMKSTDTRFILPQFKTIQQTAWWSCGPASIMTVLKNYDVLGDWNEESLAALRSDHSAQHKGTCLDQMVEMINVAGEFELVSTYDYQDKLGEISFDFFREQIQAGYPVLVGWNDWGGHWQTVIGYDTMGTENFADDVLILSDPFDTSDHNQDGYVVYNASRFLSNFNFYDFFPEDHIGEKCFIVVKPRI